MTKTTLITEFLNKGYLDYDYSSGTKVLTLTKVGEKLLEDNLEIFNLAGIVINSYIPTNADLIDPIMDEMKEGNS